MTDISDASFEAIFERELLVSERLRLRAVLGLFLAFSIAITISLLLFSDALTTFFGDALDPILALPITYLYLFYEIAAYLALNKALANNTVPHKLWGYISVLVESSIPTLAIFAAGTIVSPATSLFLPPLFLYFVVIALSALRMDRSLVWLSGVCCSVQYLWIAHFSTEGFSRMADLPRLFAVPQHHVAKALLMLVVTAATVLVVSELQKRLVSSLKQAREQQKILNIFGQQVSPQVAARLTADDDAGKSKSERVSIMFFDIRGFTTFAEGREPEAVVNYLNTLFESLVQAVSRNDGFVNKFLGDGFMAIFAASDSDETHCHNAVLAALEISERVKTLVSDKNIETTKIGIGIHAGRVVTGNIGSSDRREFTIIGDAVNLAARLEQLTKQFDREILISEEIAQAVSPMGMGTELVAETTVRGREMSEKIYALTG